jgi:hypothetical protein
MMMSRKYFSTAGRLGHIMQGRATLYLQQPHNETFPLAVGDAMIYSLGICGGRVLDISLM